MARAGPGDPIGWARKSRGWPPRYAGCRHGDAPFLAELSRELDETVDLSILDGDRADVVDQVVPQAAGRERGGGSRFRCTAAPTARRYRPACRLSGKPRALPSRLAR